MSEPEDESNLKRNITNFYKTVVGPVHTGSGNIIVWGFHLTERLFKALGWELRIGFTLVIILLSLIIVRLNALQRDELKDLETTVIAPAITVTSKSLGETSDTSPTYTPYPLTITPHSTPRITPVPKPTFTNKVGSVYVSLNDIGQEFLLDVRFEGSQDKTVEASQVSLCFDPTALEVIELIPSRAFHTVLINEFDNTVGHVEYHAGHFLETPLDIPVTFFTIRFRSLVILSDSLIEICNDGDTLTILGDSSEFEGVIGQDVIIMLREHSNFDIDY